ncbi:3,4-dihydroxy-2-butanone-4-phosphate synthase [Paraburkholderia sp. SARCC-3016]|uniref:3,4-dihydroxy-2-butanone-4-phosphate synthase n=1 Tax=Paraburkholderia sp. SARCC-3016 TaxID=3058611 RepID=UPI002808D238|nr:3,4-dihydroxy-2-butanone-4-phosphate synthase [Paraburkholderia sp. SARCC-3016]MDQ7975707.1 3,4-dihydroxy-2-butanone-4-phosphate synthase [Paraburkholderia sp. SARCC-3016]
MSLTGTSAAVFPAVPPAVSSFVSTFPEPAIRAADALADLPLPAADEIPPRIAAALQALRDGRAVVLQDDHDRENEADLIVAAERLTEATMALLIRECSGIVCLCLPDERIRALELPPMTANNESRNSTAFTVSIEARDGVSTGVSAADRLTTIRAAIADDAKPTDIVRPGHVFPLRAMPGGVLARRGHTEGTVDLVTLAGLKPAGVLCELMNADGTMTRGADVERFAAQHAMPMLTIAELVEFRQALAAARQLAEEEQAA